MTPERFTELRLLIISTPANNHDVRELIRDELLAVMPPSQRTSKLRGTDDLVLVLRVAKAFAGID